LVNYKPLLMQYECFGNCLPAFNNKNTVAAVDTIIKHYKNIISSIHKAISKPVQLSVVQSNTRANIVLNSLTPVFNKQITYNLPSRRFEKLDLKKVDEGFGYLLLRESSITSAQINLSYFDRGEYLPSNDFKLLSMRNGTRIRLRSGKYKMIIRKYFLNKPSESLEREFTIKNEMITEFTAK